MAWLHANEGPYIRKGRSVPGDVPKIFSLEQVNQLLRMQAALGKLGVAVTDVGANGIITMDSTIGREVPTDESVDIAREGIALALRTGNEAPAGRPQLRLIQGGEIVA